MFGTRRIRDSSVNPTGDLLPVDRGCPEAHPPRGLRRPYTFRLLFGLDRCSPGVLSAVREGIRLETQPKAAKGGLIETAFQRPILDVTSNFAA
jgi:hypothetical protein